MEANTSYYIYNYSVQPELLFRNDNDIELFIAKMEEHLSSVATIKKLLVNEFSFHVLISFYELIDLKSKNSMHKFNSNKLLSRKLSNCFNAYAQSYNTNYLRKGNLFQKSFKQIEILEDKEFDELLESSITKNNLKVILQ